MPIDKISSLHDDILLPNALKGEGEWKTGNEQYDPNEKSYITRLEQFGINIQETENILGKKINEISQEEYDKIISKAIKARYDIIVASVFDRHVFSDNYDVSGIIRRKEVNNLINELKGLGGKFGINVINRKEDIKEDSNLVLGMEACAHLIKNIGQLKAVSESGVKLFGLQYGEDNDIAGKNGLTSFGKGAVKYLLNKNIIIDLAHSSFKTRQDAIEIAKDFGKGNLVSYTHGSAEEDIAPAWQGKLGERALKKEEIERIIKMGGIIGLGVTKPFFNNTKKVAERINNIIQIEGGLDRVAIGTDFGGVTPYMINDIKSPEDMKILADMLSESFGLRDEEVNKILRINAKNWIKNAIS